MGYNRDTLMVVGAYSLYAMEDHGEITTTTVTYNGETHTVKKCTRCNTAVPVGKEQRFKDADCDNYAALSDL